MPIVNIRLLEGRTVDQKRVLVDRVTKAICESVNCPAQAVTIIIEDMKKEHYATGGTLFCDK